MSFLERLLCVALFCCGEAVTTDAKARRAVAVDSLGNTQLSLRCAKLPPRMMIRPASALLASPVADKFVRFAVTKTRSDGGKVEFAELILEDEAGQPMDLRSKENVVQARLDGPNVLETSGVLDFCIDGNLETSCTLEVGQSIVLELQAGRSVGSFGFKTALENSTEVRSFDPIAFKLEGSADGSAWRELSVKAAVDTPVAGGLMVGPYIVSGDSSKMSPISSAAKELPTTTMLREVPADTPVVGWAHVVSETTPPPTPVPVAAPVVTPTVLPTVLPMLRTTPAPPAPRSADAPGRVAAAVVDAAERAGMPLPQRMAAAAAAAAAAKSIAKPVSKEAIAEAASAAGLDSRHLAAVSASLAKAPTNRLPALLAVWRAAADAARRAAERAPEKVSHVVEASAAAGLSVEQQAQAAAAAAVAAVASMTTPGPEAVISEAVRAAEEAGLPVDKQSEIAAVMQAETPEEQSALLRILKAAELVPTTSPAPEEAPEFDGRSPAGKVVADTISQVIHDIPVSAKKKLQVISAAAQAAEVAAEHSSTTTSFDGVRSVVEAAEAAGIKDVEKLKRVQEEAEVLPPEKQKAAVRSLHAATDDTGTSTTPPNAADKVAAVVKAAADSGMTEDQQAEVAAAAAAAMAKVVEPAPKEGQISELIKAAKLLGLGDEELEAILASASSFSAEELESVISTMRAAQPEG